MTLLRDIAKELLGMFLGDMKLGVAILALLAAVALFIRLAEMDPLIGGGLLFVGCLAILAIITTIEARQR